MYLSLAKNDFRNIRRDSFMFFMFLVPWVILAVLRFGVPALDAALPNLNLRDYDALILSFYVMLQLVMLFGVLAGFLALDERDDGTMAALQVTPLSHTGYVIYRVLFAMLMSIVFLLIIVPLTGMFVPNQWVGLLVVTICAALLAPVMFFFLPAFARNKVEGIALMKGFGILLIGPIAAWFVTSNWHWAFAILPTFWTAKAFWSLYDGGNYLLYSAVGIVYQVVWAGAFYVRFKQKIYE